MIPVGVVLCDMPVGLEVGRAVADMAADPKTVVRVGVADMLLDAVGILRTSRPLPTVDNVVQSDEDGSG